MKFEDSLSFFPCGVHYHRAPTPLPSEWAGDMAELARCGYTHLQFRPQWRWHERVRGQCTWDDLDRLFDLAAMHGLRVVLKPMLETAPDWVFSELGGTRIGYHGVPISPFAHGAYYVGGWWPCFDNPGVAAAAGQFVREMVARYRGHEALWFYDAWNEPRVRPSGACHCEHSVVSYRQWLRQRFGTIENLNGQFGKAWTSFDSIVPPHAADDYVEMFLWKQWTGSSVAGQVSLVAQAIREQHPDAFVMMHVGSSMIVQDAVGDVSNDFLNRACVDRYGTSYGLTLHPSHPLDYTDADLQSDWVRRIDDSYWCHEFYTNGHHWSIPPRPDHLRRMVWLAIAGGASGLTHWQYRSERLGNEVNGAGMREIDGSPTERSIICDGVTDVLRRHGRALVGARRVRSDVAMLYSHESDLILRIQRMNDWWTGLASEPYERGLYKDAIQTAHGLYAHMGLTTDWVVSGDDVSKYKLLHVTAAEMIDAATADWLRAYVRGGGTLIVEFPFACRDDNTWVSLRRPNRGLEDLLGCREAVRLQLEADVPWPAKTDSGLEIAPRHWWIALTPTSGSVTARWPDGQAAAVVNSFGAGRVISLGISISWACRRNWTAEKARAMREFAAMSGITMPPENPLWIRRRRGPQGEVWFIFNVHAEAVSTRLPASPTCIWDGDPAWLADKTLTLPPHATWMAQMPATDA